MAARGVFYYRGREVFSQRWRYAFGMRRWVKTGTEAVSVNRFLGARPCGCPWRVLSQRKGGFFAEVEVCLRHEAVGKKRNRSRVGKQIFRGAPSWPPVKKITEIENVEALQKINTPPIRRNVRVGGRCWRGLAIARLRWFYRCGYCCKNVRR